jgi:hypothetical protein
MITPLPGAWEEKPGSATLPFFGAALIVCLLSCLLACLQRMSLGYSQSLAPINSCC